MPENWKIFSNYERDLRVTGINISFLIINSNVTCESNWCVSTSVEFENSVPAKMKCHTKTATLIKNNKFC